MRSPRRRSYAVFLSALLSTGCGDLTDPARRVPDAGPTADRGRADLGPQGTDGSGGVDSAAADLLRTDQGSDAPAGRAVVTYTLLTPTVKPSFRRTSGAVASLSDRDRLWIFGGMSFAAILSGLFYYDTADANWHQVPKGDTEEPRQGHAMGWEPGCKKLVIYGGTPQDNKITYNKIRVYDPAMDSFTSPTISGVEPTPRSGPTFIWIPHQGVFLVHGGSTGDYTKQYGDLWHLQFDATCTKATWIQKTSLQKGTIPSARAAACAAYDSARHRIISFGGEVATGVMSAQLFELDVDTFAWTAIAAKGSLPGPRAYAATSFHPAVKMMLVYGGQDGGGSSAATLLDDGHAYAPSTQTWSKLTPAVTPGQRADMVGVFSPALGKALYFGGRYRAQQGFFSIYVNETWSANLTTL